MEPTPLTTDPLAQHLKALRASRQLTLNELADRSGVSRATLSRIENGEVSPTVETLGRLATAFGLPVSQLIAPMDDGFEAKLARGAQAVWRDRKAGFSRRSVSPPSRHLLIEIVECEIEPQRSIAYERPAFPGHEHHLVLLDGELAVTVDGVRHALSAGDCLRYRLHGASRFETGATGARYMIAMGQR